MKIAYVIGGLPFGGVESWLFDLALSLSDNPSTEAVIINVSGTGVKAPEFIDHGLRVINVSYSKRALKTFQAGTVLKLRRLLQTEAPDLIHTLHFSGDYFGRLASIGLGIPVVVHVRNTHREKKAFRRFANRFLCRYTDAYLSVSRQVEQECVRIDHNMCSKPSLVFYNAINPIKLDVKGHNLQQMYGAGGVVITGAGRFVRQKNFDLLIRGFSKVTTKHNKVSLFLLGDGPERENLRQLVRELKLEDRVFFPGYRNDMPHFMRSTDILAMPSDYEGLPITHIEALFCGIPAVVSKHVPSLEIAAEASLVCNRNPSSIAEQIIRLVEDPELYQNLSERALAIAPAYSMDAYRDRLLSFYEALIYKRAGGDPDLSKFDSLEREVR